jgi:hypothetical protein
MSFRHKALYGMTSMGKTWTLKRIAQKLRKYKQKVLIYSGTGDLDWCVGCKVTFSVDTLERWLADAKNYGAHVILDEGRVLYAKMKPRTHPHIDNLFTMGRHKGFTAYIATQYPTSIPPAVRVNCSEIYCFRLGSKAHAKIVQEDYGDVTYKGLPVYQQILKLNQLECFHIVQPDYVQKLTLK